MWIRTTKGVLVNTDRATSILYDSAKGITKVWTATGAIFIAIGDATTQIAEALARGTKVMEVRDNG